MAHPPLIALQCPHRFDVEPWSVAVVFPVEELTYAFRAYVSSTFLRNRTQDSGTREKCNGICGHGQLRARLGLLLIKTQESPWDKTGDCRYKLKLVTLYGSFPARLMRCQEYREHEECGPQLSDNRQAKVKSLLLRAHDPFSIRCLFNMISLKLKKIINSESSFNRPSCCFNLPSSPARDLAWRDLCTCLEIRG